jgi:ferrous iron transport protein B
MNPTDTVALAGNPNVGKSTIFNALTGAHQHVGNWPGKTVEQKAGTLKLAERVIRIVDLPGTYSLSAYSLEEQIARDFIVLERPALVINVVDATNLERNLYLTAQLLDTGTPLILALNMLDVARERQLQIDTAQLAQALGGIPVVELAARQGMGIAQLRQILATTLDQLHPLALAS